MKKQPEYIFSDELKPKSLIGRLLYLCGYRKPLKDNQIIIEKPTFEELGLPDNYTIELRIKELNLFFDGLGRQVLLHLYYPVYDGSQPLKEFLNIVEKPYHETMKQALDYCLKYQFIFFDGEGYYLSDLGRLICKSMIKNNQ